MEVLYNTNETEQILEQSKESVDLDCNAIKLVGVGKVLKNKGFDRLARIHKRLREDGFPIHTYILGIGDQQNEIERFLKENQLEDSFTFLGYQRQIHISMWRNVIFLYVPHLQRGSALQLRRL